jgi:hypothetical protein
METVSLDCNIIVVFYCLFSLNPTTTTTPDNLEVSRLNIVIF